LSPDTEVAYYRVAQEALNNVVKHARASRVDVVLESDEGSVVMVIEDDGVGFDPAEREQAGGFGLAGMRQRATLIGATLQIESSLGQGAAIYLRCPLDGDALGGRP
jgi:signal transduction histidine kinase